MEENITLERKHFWYLFFLLLFGLIGYIIGSDSTDCKVRWNTEESLKEAEREMFVYHAFFKGNKNYTEAYENRAAMRALLNEQSIPLQYLDENMTINHAIDLYKQWQPYSLQIASRRLYEICMAGYK